MEVCPEDQCTFLCAVGVESGTHNSCHSSNFWCKCPVQNKHPEVVQHLQERKDSVGGSSESIMQENWAFPSNVDQVKALVVADRRVTVSSLAAQTGIPHSSIRSILHKDLKLKKKCARFIPVHRTPRHIRLRFDISSMMLRIVRENPGTLKRIITMDETWVYTYDPLSRAQSSEWLSAGDPRPQIPRRGRAVGKMLLVSFFDWRGMLYYELLRNQTMNTTVFLQILTRLQAAINVRRPRRRLQLHMDNASPHNARDTKMRLLLTGLRRVPQPPCSPDLAPNDFWFYPRLKRNLKGRTFANLDQLERAVHQAIGLIPAEEYRQCILEKWPMRWAHCVFQDGGYFEGLS